MTDATPTPDTDDVKDDPEPLVPEGWELPKSRQAILWIDGKAWRLRAPKMGELREILQSSQTVTESIVTASESLQERLLDVARRTDEGELSATDRRLADLRIGREFAEIVESLWWGALRDAVGMLCSTPLPADDDLPGWVIPSAHEQLGQLVDYWRSTPPPRGHR